MIGIRSFSGLGYSEEVVNDVYLNEMYGKNGERGFMDSLVQSGLSVGALVDTAVSGFGRLDIAVANAGVLRRAPVGEVTDERWDDMLGVDLTGVLGLIRSLGVELAPRGIRANAVIPGLIETPQSLDAENSLRPEGLAAEVAPTAVLLASEPGGNLYTGQTLAPHSGDVMLGARRSAPDDSRGGARAVPPLKTKQKPCWNELRGDSAMCGACGAPTTGWAERIAPLGAGVAERRARALTALLPTTASARRVAVSPWHGGALRLRGPAGWRFAPSLLAAARELPRRHGPLVPADGMPGTPASVSPGFRPTPEQTAAWCTAAVASGLPRRGPVVLTANGWEITMTGEDVHLAAAERDSPALHAHRGARELAAHWERHHAAKKQAGS